MLTTFKLQKQTFKCTSTKKDKLKNKKKNCSNFSTHVKKYDEESFFFYYSVFHRLLTLWDIR